MRFGLCKALCKRPLSKDVDPSSTHTAKIPASHLTSPTHDIPLTRVAVLFGEKALARLQAATVLVVGLGAVGGACAEALARSGIGRLWLVDGDVFEPSNLNRQPFAALPTLGQPKATATAERLRAIAPSCAPHPEILRVTPENAEALLDRAHPDALVDACDDVPAKVALLSAAHRRGLPAWSAMGAARKLDPAAFRVTDLSKTQVCPLARNVRRLLRAQGIVRGIRCVWSAESPRPMPPGALGSYMPATATAGLLLAADLLQTLGGTNRVTP